MASKAEETTPSLYSEIDIKEEPVLTDVCHEQPMKEFEQIYIKEENIKLEITDDVDACDPLQLEEEKRGCPGKIRLCDNAGENNVDSVEHKIPEELRNEVQLTDGSSESERLMVTDQHKMKMANLIHYCVFCKRTDSHLKCFNQDNLNKCTAVLTVRKRNNLTGHETVLPTQPNNFQLYHSDCYNRFTALPKKYRKRTASEDAFSSTLPIISATCKICGGSGRLGARDVPPTEFGNATRSTVEEGEVLSSTSQHLEPSSGVSKGTVAHLQHLMEDNHTDSSPCSECHIPLPECEVCHKVFRTHRSLSSHSSVHTRVRRRFTCSVCHEQFSRKLSLKVHSRVHAEKPSFTCSVCLEQFSRKGDLKVHSRAHKEKELYACAICQRKFKQATGLKAHLRVHSWRVHNGCGVCKKMFSLRCTHNHHSRIDTGER